MIRAEEDTSNNGARKTTDDKKSVRRMCEMELGRLEKKTSPYPICFLGDTIRNFW